jgi:phage shock protein C
MEKRLYKDEHHKMIGGVCAGLAEYFNIDVTIIRVLFFATLILKGGGLVVYIILWVCLPKKNYIFTDPTVDYKVPPSPFGNIPPQQPGDPFTGFPPKRASKGGTIAGAILIVIGSFFLLNEFDFIPDLDFSLIWPTILVAVGLILIFSGAKKQPWESDSWHQTVTNKKDENLNDNPPIV